MTHNLLLRNVITTTSYIAEQISCDISSQQNEKCKNYLRNEKNCIQLYNKVIIKNIKDIQKEVFASQETSKFISEVKKAVAEMGKVYFYKLPHEEPYPSSSAISDNQHVCIRGTFMYPNPFNFENENIFRLDCIIVKDEE